MSKLVKSFKEKEATDFVGILNDINQIAKNLRKTSDYTIKNGIIYSYKKPIVDVFLIHQKLEYTTIGNRNKAGYDEYIKLLNGIVDSGKDLYGWIKDSKKYVTQVDIYDDHFVIRTTNSSVSYESNILDNETMNLSYIPIKNYLKKVKEKDDYSVVYSDDTFENFLEEHSITDSKIPLYWTFKDEDGNDIKFVLCKKMFPTFKKTSTCEFFIYSIDKENGIYAIKYIIKNKNSILTNYTTIVNY